MPAICVPAPAKLNLHLKIGGVRADGFHSLESLFAALALGDTLRVKTTQTPGLTLQMNGRLPGGGGFERLPPEKNLVFKAVSLFRERTGYDRGLAITVEKRIPLGGGLGGGSSDAAAALIALNRLAGANTGPVDAFAGGLLDNTALCALGAALGSDVPFFLHDAPLAWVTGRGEQVAPLALPETLQNMAFVLVNPGLSSDTAAAYRLFDAHNVSGSDAAAQSFSVESALAGPPRDWPFFNDFVPAFKAGAASDTAISELWSSYQLIFSGLRELGADFTGLSGSGSTCFGVFSSRKVARAARESLQGRWPVINETFLLAYRAIQYYNSE